MTGPATAFDRPRGPIGQSVERPDANRLLAGCGMFVDDVQLPRMLHAAFLRSPYAHAEIHGFSLEAARAAPGVVAILTGADLVGKVKPYIGVLTHLTGLRSPPQMPLAVDRARWQGEPIAMAVAQSRAEAEDAVALIEATLEPLEATCDSESALDPETPVIHAEFGSNLAWERTVDVGNVQSAFARDDLAIVKRTFRFGRHTGVTLEPRGTVVDYRPAEGRLTFWYSGQAPHMMQFILANHLGLAEEDVRVVAKDVGGSFGIKIHTYGDEIATAAVAQMLGRPVKFVADRYESFLSDIHAREHVLTARMGVDRDGYIQALAFDDLTGIGPYSMYPRTSAIEANQVVNLTGAPYVIPNYFARSRVVFQNKTMMCQYRAVGHPIAMAVADGLLEEAAAAIAMDPVEIRRRNLMADSSYPRSSASGMKLDDLSHQRSLETLVEMMEYEDLRKSQSEWRRKGVHRGVGFVSMVEVTNPSPMFYGVGGAPISAQDGATLRLDAGGGLRVSSSVTEQGQGTNTVLAQVASDVFGVPIERVRVTTGDTDATPYGGGTWASRGAGIGGEATLLAAKALKSQVLDVAAVMLQAAPDALDIRDGAVVDGSTGTARMSLTELARTVYYRGNELPAEMKPELVATRHYRVTDFPFVFTNGAMASHVEVDTETGLVKLLGFWVVEDCGRVINPQLVDEQIRGGVVQGIGAALYEECLYSDDGQLRNTTLADYLVPMAAEMPDIVIKHVETPTKTSTLGAKGAGEAGTGGAPAAVMNAVNDALRPLGARVDQMPMTPGRILEALGKI